MQQLKLIPVSKAQHFSFILRSQARSPLNQLRVSEGLSHFAFPLTTIRGYLQFFEKKPEYQADNDKFNLLIEEVDKTIRLYEDI